MMNREYICAVCGTWHKDVVSRAKCEIACSEKKAEEERKEAELKKAAEYEARKIEVDTAFNKAYELKDKFVKDYGRYTYNKTTNSFDDICYFDWIRV